MAACGSEGRVFSVAGVGSAASLAVFSASCGVLLSFSGMEKAEGVFTLSASLIALICSCSEGNRGNVSCI